MNRKPKQESKKNNADGLYIPRRFIVSNSIFDTHATVYTKSKHENKADNTFNAYKIIRKNIPHFIALLSAIVAIKAYFVTDQNMRISNRAYLFIEKFNATIEKDSTITIKYHVKNYGNSPARKTRITLGCSIIKNFSDTLAYDSSSIAKIEFPIPPGDSREYTPAKSYKISPENMRLYNTDSVHIYVHGEIEYIDMFDESHHSPFCGEIVKSEERFIACPGHNDIK